MNKVGPYIHQNTSMKVKGISSKDVMYSTERYRCALFKTFNYTISDHRIVKSTKA